MKSTPDMQLARPALANARNGSLRKRRPLKPSQRAAASPSRAASEPGTCIAEARKETPQTRENRRCVKVARKETPQTTENRRCVKAAGKGDASSQGVRHNLKSQHCLRPCSPISDNGAHRHQHSPSDLPANCPLPLAKREVTCLSRLPKGTRLGAPLVPGTAISTTPVRSSSSTQDRRISYRARALGCPMKALMSARSTKARSTASVMLDVVSSITFGLFLRASSCVRSAFTARMASDGSDPDTAAFLAAVRLSTCGGGNPRALRRPPRLQVLAGGDRKGQALKQDQVTALDDMCTCHGSPTR